MNHHDWLKVLGKATWILGMLAGLPFTADAAQEFCMTPLPRGSTERTAAFTMASVLSESEPNGSLAEAQCLPLGNAPGESTILDVAATFGFNGDEDFVKFTARTGDVLSVAAVSDIASSPVDTMLTLADSAGLILQSADLHGQALSIFPPESPVRQVVSPNDAIILWVVPADGDYVIRVEEATNGTGPYTLRMFLGRPGFEAEPVGARQIIFIDFDGATVDASSLFGFGNTNAILSPLSDFLGNWGLSAVDENAVVDSIIAQISADLDSVGTLNPRFGFELRNSRDHVDTFGTDPVVSRVIVGGTAAQLGITTNGIAEWIDLGNYSTDDTAVVLLDRLSAPAGGPDSVNSIPRVPSVSIVDAVGVVVGRVISHEIGHYIGHFHTHPSNGTPTIMDRSNIPANLVGVGSDGILGSADDAPIAFDADVYDPFPGFLTGIQLVDYQTAFGLSTPANLRSFCNGDGGDQVGCTDCPCSNNSPPRSVGGCLNSNGTGSRLIASGSPSVSLPIGSTDDLRFSVTAGVAFQLYILNSGNALAPADPMSPCFGLGSGANGAAFDGLRCVIESTLRNGGRGADANGDVGLTNDPWGGEANPPGGIAQFFGYGSGTTRYFQCIHRDNASVNCMTGLNTTQAIEVTFSP